MGELQKIPGVGKQTEQALLLLGFSTIASLKGADPQDMYDRECALRGQKIDRCQLYVYRCAVYYASHTQHDPQKLKWWNWKD
ncbi:helix-hairpin-helix domain-containing protein [Oscillospiraceae bacterium LTW-04]|nr:helix-hairpin-helix domain-containing protein [Oscillospiraceae bacterium MB24-C1]